MDLLLVELARLPPLPSEALATVDSVPACLKGTTCCCEVVSTPSAKQARCADIRKLALSNSLACICPAPAPQLDRVASFHVHFQSMKVSRFLRCDSLAGECSGPLLLRSVVGGHRHLVCIALKAKKDECYPDRNQTRQYAAAQCPECHKVLLVLNNAPVAMATQDRSMLIFTGSYLPVRA